MRNSEKLLLLPLLSSASVKRKYDHFEIIVKSCRKLKIPKPKIYETVLQTYLFAGFPSALISLKLLSEVMNYSPKPVQSSLYERRKNGVITCKKVYGNKYDKLINTVNKFSPDLADWLITEGYGKVLSRKSLSLKEREMCIISMLASLRFESQLYSHINGAHRQSVTYAEMESIFKNLIKIKDIAGSTFGLKVLNQFKLKKGANNNSPL